MPETKRVVVISGPTGSGESTITNAIVRAYPARVSRLVTATTRAPRPDEREGVDYYFFTKEEFLAKKAAGEMLETTYVQNRDTYYGTYAPDLEKKLAAGFIVIANPDAVGTRFYKERYGAVSIFVMPGSMDELISRLRKRNPEMTEEDLSRRRDNAEREVREDYPFYDYTVVNADGKLEKAVADTVSIMKKEGYVLE